MHHPQASVPSPGERERKQQLLGAQLLTQDGGGVWQPQLRFMQVACGDGTSRQLQQTVVCLLWWESLPVPTEAGAGMWGRGDPAPCAPLNNGTSLSRQTTLPLGAFPASHPLTPVPSAVSAQSTALLSLDLFSQLHTLALSPHHHRRTLIPGRGTQS